MEKPAQALLKDGPKDGLNEAFLTDYNQIIIL